MDPAAKPGSVAKKQYENIRRSLSLFEERVVARYWEEDTLARASFGHFLGSLDQFAGWLLADDELSRRGQALRRWTSSPDEEPSGEPGSDQQEQEGNPAAPAGWANAGAEQEQAPQAPQAPQAAAERPAEQPPEPAHPAAEATLVNVAFTLPAEVQAGIVMLCGEFNQWSVEGIQLERGTDGSWRAIVALEPGRSYRYRYLLDGERWENAWQADSYEPNPYGGADSVITVVPPLET